MKQRISIVLSLALTGWCGVLAAQVPADAKKPADDVASQIKALHDAVMDKKSERDDAATAIIDKLLSASETMAAKDKDAFIAALGDIYTKAKPRPPEKNALYLTAAVTLSRLGAPGAKVLLKAFGDEKFKKKEWVDLRARFLTSIGKTKDDSQITFLVERAVRDPDDPILKAAGEALGNFADKPGTVRRDIVKELVKKYNDVANSASNVDPGNVQAKASRDTLAVISDAWNETLGKLTKQEIRSAPEWQRWWNKNKDADWDKLKK